MRFSALFAPVVLFVLQAPQALALTAAPIKPPTQITGVTGGGNAAIYFVCLGLKWLFTAAIVFSIILALLAAIDYMRGGGDPGRIKTANNRLVYTAIGVAVAILARTMPVIVGGLVGATKANTDTTSLCPAR